VLETATSGVSLPKDQAASYPCRSRNHHAFLSGGHCVRRSMMMPEDKGRDGILKGSNPTSQVANSVIQNINCAGCSKQPEL
jgi:hypothetical protein